MNDATRRAIRTLMHLIAGGGLTVIVDMVVKGLTPASAALVMAIWTVVISFAHNYAEDHTAFPALLKAQPSSGQNPVTEDPAT